MMYECNFHHSLGKRCIVTYCLLTKFGITKLILTCLCDHTFKILCQGQKRLLSIQKVLSNISHITGQTLAICMQVMPY